MLELFVIGTLWFWLYAAVVFAVLVALTESEKPGWALSTIIASTVLVTWANGGSPLTWVAHHPVTVVVLVVAYFVGGVLNARYKWGKVVYGKRRELNEEIEKFLKDHGIEGTVIPPELEEKWFSRISIHRYAAEGILSYKPRLRDHKGQIITWMAYWPWSVFWTLLNDPIRWAFEEIYALIHGWFQSVADDAFKDAPIQQPKKKPEPPKDEPKAE